MRIFGKDGYPPRKKQDPPERLKTLLTNEIAPPPNLYKKSAPETLPREEAQGQGNTTQQEQTTQE